MNVVITGASGFLGQRLARTLLQRGTLADASGKQQAIASVTLLDVAAAPPIPDHRVHVVTGDIADSAVLSSVIDAKTHAVFHLAAVVSGQAEREFGLGMRVNLDAARCVLDACHEAGARARVVFTSSVAVYGGDLSAGVNDQTALTPRSSYGTQKAIAELLLADYSRKGFVDGRVARLPTISVRPGRPNAAASSFASGIIREPLNGEVAVCPVSGDTRLWLASPHSAINNLVALHDLPDAVIGNNRSINFPGISISVDQMIAALRSVAGEAVASRVQWQRDAEVERIVGGWPPSWDTARATSLGLASDQSFEDVVRAYMDEQHIRIG